MPGRGLDRWPATRARLPTAVRASSGGAGPAMRCLVTSARATSVAPVAADRLTGGERSGLRRSYAQICPASVFVSSSRLPWSARGYSLARLTVPAWSVERAALSLVACLHNRRSPAGAGSGRGLPEIDWLPADTVPDICPILGGIVRHPATLSLVRRRRTRRKICPRSDCSQAVNMPLDTMAKNSIYLPVWRPEHDSNLRPTA